MELKIVNPTAELISEQFGIDNDRLEELTSKLEDIIKRLVLSEAEVPKSAVWNEIASFCNTTEELICCLHAHDSFVFQNFGL